MASFPRSGLFGFLLLLAALDPSAAGLASSTYLFNGEGGGPSAPEAQAQQGYQPDPTADSVEARMRRISEALRQQAPGGPEAGEAADPRLAWVFANGVGPFLNGGFGNGGFRNGGWGNGGFRNGGWGNGGFRNGGWGNGGGWRNGGFLNRW